MRYRITHVTTYEYAEPVSLCQNLAHLAPRESPTQRCPRTGLLISPEPAVVNARRDYFGNEATFFSIQEPHRRLVITADHVVDIAPRSAPEPDRSPAWETVRDLLRFDCRSDVLDASQFTADSRYIAASSPFSDYAAASFPSGTPVIAGALDLMQRIHGDFEYDKRTTDIATSLPEMFAQRSGVCQDFAHLQIACLRSLGLAARYVSGYLSTEAPPGCVPLVGADATHAWLAVFCPETGWVDVDPTNNVVPGEKHVTLAWGRDYDDVSPVKGIVLGGGQHDVGVAVDVRCL